MCMMILRLLISFAFVKRFFLLFLIAQGGIQNNRHRKQNNRADKIKCLKLAHIFLIADKLIMKKLIDRITPKSIMPKPIFCPVKIGITIEAKNTNDKFAENSENLSI